MEVIGIPVVSGRGFERTDTRDGPRVAIVNETMARRFWREGSAIGERLRTFDDSTMSIEIVGVAADVRHEGLASTVEPTVFLPAAQATRSTSEWVLRIRGDLISGIQRAREVVAEVSPATPVTRVMLLEETIADSVAIPRFRTLLIGGLAGIASALALLGVYGVLTFSVAQRTSEIGVRKALGARSQSVVTDVVGSGVKVALAGVAIGLLVGWSIADTVRGFLFEVAPSDPTTYTVVIVGVLSVSGLAAYLPARRAAAVDPAGVLNSE